MVAIHNDSPIWASIARFRCLKHLDLSYIDLSGAGASVAALLAGGSTSGGASRTTPLLYLERLELNNCQLGRGNHPTAAIAKLSSLTHLSLANNKMCLLGQLNVECLEKLTFLDTAVLHFILGQSYHWFGTTLMRKIWKNHVAVLFQTLFTKFLQCLIPL